MAPPPSAPEPNTTGAPAPADDDVSTSRASLGDLFRQLGSFNRVFWIGNIMEMIERLAYYGLRTVVTVYMVLSLEQGGPQFDHVQKGVILSWWAWVQSMLPIVTGGYADRYGYKLTIGIAIAIKIAGYLVMAFAVDAAMLIAGPAAATQPGHPTTYGIFLLGAVLLAAGTAIFKPGLQGILAHQLEGGNASLGWSLFYQLVNVGGFLGPYLAGAMRLLDWKWVFVSCAVIVSLNYLLLLTFRDPAHEAPEKGDEDGGFLSTLWRSAIGICEPRLLSFLVVFSGFWMMFHQLFDLLPNFIDDWVDSSMVLGSVVAPAMGAVGLQVPDAWGGHVPQEFLINVNAGMCMLLAFVIGYLTGKVRSMSAMILGILVSSAAIYSLGLSMNGWVVVAAIALFSIGELSASPTKMRYFSSIAPPGKKGLYLGYINATNGIGWAIGSRIAGHMYEEGGDKVVLARRHLVEAVGMGASEVEALPKDDVVPLLAERLGTTPAGVREVLWSTYHPDHIWTHFALVGLVSMVGLVVFDQITRRAPRAREPFLLLALTAMLSTWTYGVAWGATFTGLGAAYLLLERYAPHLLPGAGRRA